MKTVKNNPTKSRERFRAEIWDQMQFFFQEYNDHQVHAVINFDGLLDRDCLQKAVFLTMELTPLLGSKFVVNKFRPYWEKVSQFQATDIISFVDSPNPEEELSRFITGMTNELTGPQLMVRVIGSFNKDTEGIKDTLCIVINHMVCDGAGFKEYLYLLSAVYTKLLNGTDHFAEYHHGSRSAKQIYRTLKLRDRLKIFLLPNQPQKNKKKIYFPLSNAEDPRTPFILTHKLAPDRFHLLKAYGKKYSATINDIILTAYYRALSKILDLKPDESLTIPCMVDLRRYLPNNQADAICNLSSMIICNIGPEIGTNFAETLRKVNQAMTAQKKGYPGMHGLSTLNTIFKFLPFATVRKLIKRKFINPLIAITNIGIIDSEKLSFGKTPIGDAFMTGSIKYPPYFQLALSSFNNTITFSINLYGSERDREFIRKFFEILDQELLFN